MIEISCTCGKKINVPDTLAGKKGKCPGCGSILEVPAASKPPAPQKDELTLELEDAKPKQKSIAALIPPVQELPDAKGPKKKAAHIHSDDLMGDEPPKNAPTKAPRPVGSAPVPEGQVPCPQCGQLYTSDILFCMKCSVDIATGKPISGVLPGRKAKKADEYDPDLPFWQITLRMFYKPLNTMQYIASWFERKDVRIQMIAFYVLSFVALAIAGNSRSHKTESLALKGPSDEQQIAKIEAENPDFTPHIFESWTKSGEPGIEAKDGKPFIFRINDPKEPVESGASFHVKFAFCEPGPGKGLDGDAWIVPTQKWMGPMKEYADWSQARTAGQVGDYEADIETEVNAGSSFVILLYPKGADPADSSVAPRSAVHVAWASKPGWGRKVYTALGRTEPEKRQSIDEDAAKLERKKATLRAPADWQKASDKQTGLVGQINTFYWKLEGASPEVEAGKKFMVTMFLALEKDGKAGDPLDVEVYAKAYGGGFGAGAGEAVKPGKASPVAPGKYQFEAAAALRNSTIVEFDFCPKGQELTAANRQGLITVTFPTKSGWAKAVLGDQRKAFEKEHDADKPTAIKTKDKKVLVGSSAVLGGIVLNLFGLLASVGICFAVARFIGGGGNILLLLCTLAYLTGFTNLLQLAVIFVPAAKLAWAEIAFVALEGLMTIVAFAKVLDQPPMSGVIAGVVTSLVKFFLLIYLILALFGSVQQVAL